MILVVFFCDCDVQCAEGSVADSAFILWYYMRKEHVFRTSTNYLLTANKHSFGAPILSHGKAISAQVLISDANGRTCTCAL